MAKKRAALLTQGWSQKQVLFLMTPISVISRIFKVLYSPKKQNNFIAPPPTLLIPELRKCNSNNFQQLTWIHLEVYKISNILQKPGTKRIFAILTGVTGMARDGCPAAGRAALNWTLIGMTLDLGAAQILTARHGPLNLHTLVQTAAPNSAIQVQK